MPRKRRLAFLLGATLLIGAPAAVLRAACVGAACEVAVAAPDVPFCSLPDAMRAAIERGFYEDRSPDVIGIATEGRLAAEGWPTESASVPVVPLMFAGSNVRNGATIPEGIRLDAVAPTIAAAIGLDRPHPEVRSGEALDIVADGPPPLLVVEIVWKDIGSPELDDASTWPRTSAIFEDGAATMEARTGALPLSSAATTTTIGTGGLPSRHGITGEWVRGNDGRAIEAWVPSAPVSVIASLADDLDADTRNASRIGLVATETSDLGAIGGNWYPSSDRDDVVTAPTDPVASANKLLSHGYGEDEVTDLLVVILEGTVEELDEDTASVIRTANEVSGGDVLFVLTATGPLEREGPATTELVERINERVAPIVSAVVPGGLFLDQDSLAREKVTDDAVVEELRAMPRSFADAFPELAITFARYC